MSKSWLGMSGIILLFSAIGYFVYGGLHGFFGILILGILIELVSLLGLIPILGIILYWFVSKTYIIPWVLNLTGLTSTWVINMLFVFGLLVAIFLSLVALFLILIKAWKGE